MTVRISATDWCDGGIDADDAVAIARAFADAGADVVDVSTGQVVAGGAAGVRPRRTRPRSPTGSATRSGVATMAVGVISSYDDVNSILLAGRADLCALGRAHLYDPNWTLHAATEQGYAGPGATWPLPWQARRPQAAERPHRRAPTAAGPRPRRGATGTAHRRWRP